MLNHKPAPTTCSQAISCGSSWRCEDQELLVTCVNNFNYTTFDQRAVLFSLKLKLVNFEWNRNRSWSLYMLTRLILLQRIHILLKSEWCTFQKKMGKPHTRNLRAEELLFGNFILIIVLIGIVQNNYLKWGNKKYCFLELKVLKTLKKGRKIRKSKYRNTFNC